MINWTVRFKNKTWLLTLLCAVVAFIYQMLGIFGVTTPIAQDQVVQLLGLVVNILVAIGIVQDPTTSGLADSVRALDYSEPYKD